MAPSRAAGAPPSTSGRFFGCYLVGSRNPVMRGRTYVGFTVDPPRRIRQHNGVLASGAKYTRRLRPCSMLLVVYGFPSKVQALQFEWAWQKPRLSRAVRETAVALGVSDKSSSVINKTKLVMAMCSLSPWKHLPLTLHFFDDDAHRIARERCALSPLPEQMTITKSDMEAFSRNAGPFGGRDDDDDDGGDGDAEGTDVSLSQAVSVSEISDVAVSGVALDAVDVTSRRAFWCGVCGEGHARVETRREAGTSARRQRKRVGCPQCDFRAHPSCLAAEFFRQAAEAASAADAAPPPDRALIPSQGRCPACRASVSWGCALAAGRREAPLPAVFGAAPRGASSFPSREGALTRDAKRSATVLGAGFYDDLDDESDDDDDGARALARWCDRDAPEAWDKENAAPRRESEIRDETLDVESPGAVLSDADAEDAAPLRDRLARRAAGARPSPPVVSGNEREKERRRSSLICRVGSRDEAMFV